MVIISKNIHTLTTRANHIDYSIYDTYSDCDIITVLENWYLPYNIKELTDKISWMMIFKMKLMALNIKIKKLVIETKKAVFMKMEPTVELRCHNTYRITSLKFMDMFKW